MLSILLVFSLTWIVSMVSKDHFYALFIWKNYWMNNLTKLYVVCRKSISITVVSSKNKTYISKYRTIKGMFWQKPLRYFDALHVSFVQGDNKIYGISLIMQWQRTENSFFFKMNYAYKEDYIKKVLNKTKLSKMGYLMTKKNIIFTLSWHFFSSRKTLNLFLFVFNI